MRITGWVDTGIFDVNTEHTDDLLDQAARALDKSYAYEIVGSNLFVGENGKLYTAETMVQIGEAHPDWARERIQETLDALDENRLEYPIRSKFLKGLLKTLDEQKEEAERRLQDEVEQS